MSDTEHWKKHWNTKIEKQSKLWYPGIEENTCSQEDLREAKEEAYDRGWNDACEELEDRAWRIKR